MSSRSNYSVAECFSEKLSWCWNEQVKRIFLKRLPLYRTLEESEGTVFLMRSVVL